jgi:P4 family phage/plasmid primase-like protien
MNEDSDLTAEWVIRQYDAGMNPMPWNTKENRPVLEEYTRYRETPPTREQIEQWMPLFVKYGVAQMTGLCHRGKFKGLYLNCADFDDPIMLDRLLKIYSLEQISREGIFVEQHHDNKDKAHLWVWSKKPFAKLGPGHGIEVKSGGMLCNSFPSFNEGGYRYFPVGDSLKIFSDVDGGALTNDYFVNVIDRLVDGKYLSGKEERTFNANRISIEADNDLIKWKKGQRHHKILSYADHLCLKYGDDLSPEQLREEIYDKCKNKCEPPYTNREDIIDIEQILRDAPKWSRMQRAKEQAKKENSKSKYTKGGREGGQDVGSGAGGNGTSTQQQQQQESSEYGNITRDQFEQELIKKYHFKATKDTEELYYYDSKEGIYVKNGEWLIKQESLKYNPGISSAIVDQIIQHIIWGNYINRSGFNRDIQWLVCKNVVVNLVTGEVKEHSPDFMATVHIPHVYLYRTPHVSLPNKILKFLHEVMDSAENVEKVLDFVAYCLWRALPFHRWILFNGSGRNGKGVTTELITRFLGEDNVSNETLQRILVNNFATASLFGKMANIDADLSSEELKQTGTLKKLTGNDSIPGEYKFRQAFRFKNYAKLIFSANEIPRTPDESDAFFARLLIINFPNQYLADKANPYLIDELATEEELSALLSLVLKRLPRVLKNGISNNSIQENYEKYIQSSDPIRLFVETAIEILEGDGNWVIKDELYDAYEWFCAKKNLPKESSETFSRRLRDMGFDYKSKSISGVKTRVWVNVKLKDYKKPDEDQEILI